MLSPPMSALAIPARFGVTEPLFRALLRRLGRVQLIGIQIEPDAGGAARAWRSYTICIHEFGQQRFLSGRAPNAASRDRRTRILSIARFVDWIGRDVDRRTHSTLR